MRVPIATPTVRARARAETADQRSVESIVFSLRDVRIRLRRFG
jgi:hypothetical protein